EPLPAIDLTIESTSSCQVFRTAPAAEAASSFARASVASAVPTAIALVTPHRAPDAIATPHVPVAAKWLAPQEAEPVMSRVWPRAADSPIVSIRPAASSHMPEVPGFIHRQTPDIAPAASGPAADFVESLLPCATAAVLLPAATTDQTMQTVEV